jgi:hypothetical protein
LTFEFLLFMSPTMQLLFNFCCVALLYVLFAVLQSGIVRSES